MREPGNALCLRDTRQRTDPAKELKEEPVQKHEGGGYINRSDENDDEDQRYYADAGIEDQESAHDTGDGAAGSDGRYGTPDIQDGLRQGRRNARNQVEDEEFGGTHHIFDVRAKDPEKPHVADQVKPAAVQKHGSDERA